MDPRASNLLQGVNYNIFLSLQSAGSQEGNSEFVLRDATGALVSPSVGNDDVAPGFLYNSFAEFSVPSTGTYYVDVFSHSAIARGDYSLLLTSLVASRLNAFFGTTDDGITAGASERDFGGAGDDNINLSTAGRDALGDQGDDTLTGNGLSNILSGGIGNDNLLGLTGAIFCLGMPATTVSMEAITTTNCSAATVPMISVVARVTTAWPEAPTTIY